MLNDDLVMKVVLEMKSYGDDDDGGDGGVGGDDGDDGSRTGDGGDIRNVMMSVVNKEYKMMVVGW